MKSSLGRERGPQVISKQKSAVIQRAFGKRALAAVTNNQGK